MPLSSLLLASTLALTPAANAAPGLDLDFQDGVAGWRVVLDGVMGGLSTGRVTSAEPGVLRFAGTLSLENNGGFAQIRRGVTTGSLDGTDGLEVRVRGDGRTYTFDIRCTNVRLMAGGYQTELPTVAGEWTTVRLPYDSFEVYNFGRRLPNAPALRPDLIESVGVTLGDKKPGGFVLEIDSIRSFSGAGTAAASPSGNDLGSVATRAGLTTLLDLVAASGIADALPAGQRLTIFAPTNDAFAQLSDAQVKTLLSPEGRPLLRRILAHHVTTPALASSDLFDRRGVESLANQRIMIDARNALTVGGAKLVATDVPFDGGVVHVIDRIIMPETRSIAEVAAGDERFSTLVAALGAANLADLIGPENEGPFTVFAPTNAAFAALPAGTVEALLQPSARGDLAAILALHVVPGRLYAKDLPKAGSVRSLGEESLAFGLANGRLTINDSIQIIGTNIPAANGVIHVIDTVILPAPAPERAASPGASQPFPEAIAIIERAVELGAPLFNDGSPEACAAVYEMAIRSVLTLSSDRLGRTLTNRFRTALAEARDLHDAAAQAWIYREAMDEAFTVLSNRSEAREVATSH